MANSETDADLKTLLHKLDSKSGLELSPSSINSQISPVLSAFLPSAAPSARSLAHLVISKLVSNARPSPTAVAASSYESSLETATQNLTRLFSPIIESRLSETSLEAVVPALGLFTALFQIDPATASGIFAKDGVAEAVMDVPDLFEGKNGITASQAVAALLSQASGSKPCRPLVQAHAVSWLQDQVRRDSVDPGVRAAAANALTKLSRGTAEDKHQTGAKPTVNITSEALPPEEKASVALLYGACVIVLNLVAFRPKLSEEEKQVDRLKRMTKEGARIGGKLADPDAKEAEEPLELDSAVKRRCKRVLKAGVLPALVSMSYRKESEGIRRALGRIFLSLVDDKENRGKIVQGGGVKALQRIIEASFTSLKETPAAPPPKKPPSKFDSTAAAGSSSSAKSLDPQDLPAIQALAKLSITASPLLLFGPDASSSLDAVNPLSHLLLNPSSTLLQKFESLMALTNLASLGPVLASRVATQKEPGLGTVLNKTETLLLDDHTMVRRAATELICNLVASEDVWERYTGEKADGTRSEESDKVLVNRLRLLLAMADVDDVQTRLAASGALAMLSNARDVSRLMLGKMENGAEKTLRVLVDLIAPSREEEGGDEDDDRGDAPPTPEIQSQLAYRGVVCTRMLLTNLPSDADTLKSVVKAAKSTDLGGALVKALSSQENAGNQEMLAAGADALKWLIGKGVEIVI
ncbi:hypothetical protein FS837_012992 [Tulasnella sp. UAMH 9824]|nr:hypothetical protein FS837_012992 [Tulasnella sp. UAMH 9824]